MMRVAGPSTLAALIEAQLARRRRGAGVSASASSSAGSAASPLERLHGLVAARGIADPELRKALVRGLLLEQFGEELANDPAFERIAGRVASILDTSVEGTEMIEATLRQLSGSTPTHR